MPRYSKISRTKSIHEVSIASSLLDFLVPSASYRGIGAQYGRRLVRSSNRVSESSTDEKLERLFYSALSRASLCAGHQGTRPSSFSPCHSRTQQRRQVSTCRVPKAAGSSRSMSTRSGQQSNPASTDIATDVEGAENVSGSEKSTSTGHVDDSLRRHDPIVHAFQGLVGTQNRDKSQSTVKSTTTTDKMRTVIEGSRLPVEFFTDLNSLRRVLSPLDDYKMQPWVTKRAPRPGREERPKASPRNAINHFFWQRRRYHSSATDTELRQKRFSEGSHLPPNFFDDISVLRGLLDPTLTRHDDPAKALEAVKVSSQSRDVHVSSDETVPSIEDQLKLLKSVRDLEEKLAKAKRDLSKSMADVARVAQPADSAGGKREQQQPIVLTKEDYMNLVDLYYYSHNSRFSPESTDLSPTPLVLDDYSFALSSDFSEGAKPESIDVNEDENYESPLKHVEEILKDRQLQEIAVMQVFVDLLLDDYSSNRALYDAYKRLPDPGVAYLPKGTLRLFMQRMSTPWTISETSMLRYLSLIEEMQKAKLPITNAEWSSAIYLAGRAFNKVTSEEVANAFGIWKTMEKEAGVTASHVTFNILFDIAVRAGKFALGETVLKEMYSRNLRLNRLGRVSFIYYHGLRKDGDGVRKAYRDFVEAGEIVDTLVLNCVVASLLNAQEPQAAEQVYARMKDMHSRIQKGLDRDGNETFYRRYPNPEINTIDQEMASAHLGRILERAPHLRSILPHNHQRLQSSMPLTPDHITFRAMIAYHATTTGDLDRISVLLNEMTDVFHLPLQTITFQHLFKGFAIHGPLGGPESAWSIKRLDMCWDACRAAIKASVSFKKMNFPKGSEPTPVSALPSMAQINGLPEHAPLPNINPPLSRPPPRRLSDWSEFVLDLAAFPRERVKLLERFHATMFDAEDAIKPHEKPGPHTWSSPFFQSTVYTAPEPSLDADEGEYVLPSPSKSGVVHLDASTATSNPRSDMEELLSVSGMRLEEEEDDRPHQVKTNRMIICWLLRAYARNTKSRAKVEEIWGQVRKVYTPRDANERETVVRVLRRCLRDCDREGSG